jgi:hypothetical protein
MKSNQVEGALNMANTLKLRRRRRARCSEDVGQVTLPGVAGQMGFIHAIPLITQMEPGEDVRKDGQDCSLRRARDSMSLLPARHSDGSAIPTDRIDRRKPKKGSAPKPGCVKNLR